MDLLDLYAEGFDPVLGREERALYHDTKRNRDPVRDHVERLEAATALYLCFPVWNYGFPAILKGWFDRVFLPGVSFDIVDGAVRPALGNIDRLCVATTYGGDRLRTILAGDPPRRVVGRQLRWLVARGAAYDYLALYDMNRADASARAAFLDRVGERAGRGLDGRVADGRVDGRAGGG